MLTAAAHGRWPGAELAALAGYADLDPVWREMSELSPGGYRFALLQDGPARWRMQVTRGRRVSGVPAV